MVIASLEILDCEAIGTQKIRNKQGYENYLTYHLVDVKKVKSPGP